MSGFGTFCIADMMLNFRLPDVKSGKVVVHIVNGLDGESAKVECSPEAFAASMALCMDFDGFDHNQAAQNALYELAETIPFPSNNLRWIP